MSKELGGADISVTQVGGVYFRILSGRWPDVALRTNELLAREHGWRVVGFSLRPHPDEGVVAYARTEYAMVASASWEAPVLSVVESSPFEL
jgi:hypothetical protein